MVANAVAIVGIVGVIGSLVFAGLQSREVARQTRIQNALAGASGLQVTIDALRAVMQNFVDYPELRAYFFDGTALPAADPVRAQVLTIADMLADVLESGLHATSVLPSNNSHEDWRQYGLHFMTQSPALSHIVTKHPDWWPLLSSVRACAQPPTPGAPIQNPGSATPPQCRIDS